MLSFEGFPEFEDALRSASGALDKFTAGLDRLKESASALKSLKPEELLLPLVIAFVDLNKLLDYAVTEYRRFATEHPLLSGAISALTLVVLSYATAWKMVAAAEDFALALAGPGGWAILAAGTALAVASAAAMNELVESAAAAPMPGSLSHATRPAGIGGYAVPQTTVNVTVEGNVLSPEGLAQSIAPCVKQEIDRIQLRNQGYAHW